jgi:hypothetical protein
MSPFVHVPATNEPLMINLPYEMQVRVEHLLHDNVVMANPVTRGHTLAGRWLLTMSSSRRLFLKVGTTVDTAEALRREWYVYERLTAAFMPRVVGWDGDPITPILILEDLSGGWWPPPWGSALVGEVLATLEILHSSRIELESFDVVQQRRGNGWRRVAANPTPLMRLGVVTRDWLETALPHLIRASDDVQTCGSDVIHFDLRSDNICRTARGVVIIDWNHACLGNGALDVGFWLPSLEAEGGPKAEEILSNRPDIAAWVSGHFAARAGLPPGADAPNVRRVQFQQLLPALRWVARELELPLPRAN